MFKTDNPVLNISPVTRWGFFVGEKTKELTLTLCYIKYY
jgi:hypothetical protein